MNILHMKYAVEIAKAGSLNKASEKLLVAQPNLSRSVKELEGDLGITIFERSAQGMRLTPDGERFIGYARKILDEIDEVENLYKNDKQVVRRFSISVPRSSYISDAFSNFCSIIGKDPAEIFYKETNTSRVLHNLLRSDYSLGIIRYAENYDKYFKAVLEEKELSYEIITEFQYVLVMHKDNPLANREELYFSDLHPYIEVAHADPYVPSLPLAQVQKQELPDNTDRKVFVFERASQFELLAKCKDTFMWMSPVPDTLLKRYDLVQKKCPDNTKKYRDVLIYKKDYKLTNIDKLFIKELYKARDEHI